MKKENILNLPLIMSKNKMYINWNSKISGIYAWVNEINGKMYIGKANNLYKRVYCEMNSFKNNKPQNLIKIERAIKKYGIDNFRVVQLLQCSKNFLNKAEQIFIKYYDSKKNGYNCTHGGEGTSGRIVTKEQIKKHKEVMKNYWNEERKKQHSEKMKLWFNSKSKDEQEKMMSGHMWWLNKECKEIHIKQCKKALTKERIEKQRKSILKYYENNDSKRLIMTTILSPLNETIKIRGIDKFCKKYNVSRKGILSVLSGNKIHHKGWHINQNFKFIIPNTKKLISPTNIIYEFYSILKFCREHSLDLGAIKNVLNKKSKHHKLWRLPETSLVDAITNNSPIYKNIQFKFEDGHIESVFDKTRFCEKHGFSSKYLYKFLKNKSVGDMFHGLKLVSK
jgi:group I intron endonuclease